VACFVLLLGVSFWAGCRPAIEDQQIIVRVDNREISLSSHGGTVRDALDQAGVELGEDDIVQPDLWVELQDGMSIRVVRVQQEIIVESEALPYREQTIKSEALPAGERKLLQAGKNGQAEITYRLQFEDGVQVARSVLRQVVVVEPVDQITAVGTEGMVGSVEVEGTVAYLNGGNAWIMRGVSGGRHPVTSRGDLDGHVFALSPDGAYLLYSVPTDTVEFDGPFNELYLLNVALVDEEPRRLGLQNVLWADWAPCEQGACTQGAQAEIAYSTGVKSGPPGWKANNDLWLVSLLKDGQVVESKPVRLLAPQSSSTYSWWGSQYAWSPDGQKVAYARPDQVGWIDVQSRRVFPLAAFVPPHTYRNQVWVPVPAWSADSQFVASVIHGVEAGRPAEESQLFEIWVLGVSNGVRARLTHAVGMWSRPRWSLSRDGESLIAYAEAETPGESYESRYTLKVMDRDGSNKRAVFPEPGEVGLAPPLAYEWSPSEHALMVLYRGDLYLVDVARERVYPLTGDGQSTQLDWAE
jgi:uncharacterized protein YabE (DUF348 family)